MSRNSSYEYFLAQIIRRVLFGADITLTGEQVEELSGLIKKASKSPQDEVAIRAYYGLDCERVTERKTAEKLHLSSARVQQLRYRTERSLRNILVSQRKFIIKSSAQKELMESMEEEIKILKNKIAELHNHAGSGHIELNDCLPLAELKNEIGVRARYALERHGVKTLGELAKMTREEILMCKNVGSKSLGEIENLLKKYGLCLANYRREEGRVIFNKQAPNIGELLKHISVDALDLSVRTSNCLEEGGIKNLAQLVNKKDEDLMVIRNFGKTCLKELKRKLILCGLSLAPAKDRTT